MGKPLSMDLRRRAIDAYRRGDGTQQQIAHRFGVGVASLRRWLGREQATGSAAPITDYPHGRAPIIDVVNMDVLRQLMTDHRDATNAELADLLAERTGVDVSAPTISRAIGVLGWTRKKSASSPAKPFPRVLSVFVKRGGNGSEP